MLQHKLIACNIKLNVGTRHSREQLIQLSDSLIKQSLCDFCASEMFAGFMDVFQTSALAYIFKTFPDLVKESAQKWMLVGVGPVMEKVWFFFLPLITCAWEYFHQDPTKPKNEYNFFLRKAFDGGMNTLLWDIAIHDPIYCLGMYFGQDYFPQFPVAVISAASFLIGIGIVTKLQVLAKEMSFSKLTRQISDLNFAHESYYESRFYLDDFEGAQGVLDNLMHAMIAKYNIVDYENNVAFHDKYFPAKIEQVAGRDVFIRLRKHELERASDNSSVQLLFTQVSDATGKAKGPYKYYVTRKEKYSSVLLDEQAGIPEMSELSDSNQKNFLTGIVSDGHPATDIHFIRTSARDPQGISFIIDKISGPDGTIKYTLELKVWHDIKKLKDATTFLMAKLPVPQTTHNKLQLTHLENNTKSDKP